MREARRVIDIDFRKWMTRPHWRFEMNLLDRDEWGTWLWTPPGSTAQRGAEPTLTFDHLNVKLIAPGAWWTAIWNDSGGFDFDLYIDIVTPAAWDGDHVTMIDLDLDVIRMADGTVRIDDEDEFAAHQLDYGYPQAVIERTRAVATAIQRNVQEGQEPFNRVGAARMRQAGELAKSLEAPGPAADGS